MDAAAVYLGLLLGLLLALDQFQVSYAETLKYKMFCEGAKARIRCKKNQLIFLYSAEYGWAAGELRQCGIKKAHLNKCNYQIDVSTVISSLCEGKQRCMFKVSGKRLGYPCGKGLKHRLKVHYSCVPKKKPTTKPTTEPTTRAPTTHLVTTLMTEERENNTIIIIPTTTALTTPLSRNGTGGNETDSALQADSPMAFQSGTPSYVFRVLTSFIACIFYAIGSGKQGALLSFVCAGAGGILIMLFVMLAISCTRNRSAEFSIESSVNDDTKKDSFGVQNGTLRPHIPSERADEPEEEDLHVKPRVTGLAGNDQMPEEFGYIADDIMKYYSSRNIGTDSQRSIRKLSMSYEEPELISMANETPDVMDNKYNSFSKYGDSREIDYDELMEQLNAISYQFTLSNLEYDELDNAIIRT